MTIFSNLIAKVKKIIYGYSTPHCIGVDISSTAIKMVQLFPNSLRIAKYSIQPLAPDLVVDGAVNDIDRVAEILCQQWLDFKPNYPDVAIAIPYNAIVSRELTTPLFSHKTELDTFIQQQLSKDLDSNELVFDYFIKKISATSQEIAVVATKIEKIEEYQALLQLSGMQLAAIDVEPFAIQFLWTKVCLAERNLAEQVLWLDLGASRIRASVWQDGQAIAFNELSVNYRSWIKDSGRLVQAILSDVGKLLQLLNSAMLVEKRLGLAQNLVAYVYGGNSLIPGLNTQLSASYFPRLSPLNILLKADNEHVPAADLACLINAIALATWGQDLEQN